MIIYRFDIYEDLSFSMMPQDHIDLLEVGCGKGGSRTLTGFQFFCTLESRRFGGMPKKLCVLRLEFLLKVNVTF